MEGGVGASRGIGAVMEILKVSEFPGDVNSGTVPNLGAGGASHGPM
jgi:hypothetical protein